MLIEHKEFRLLVTPAELEAARKRHAEANRDCPWSPLKERLWRQVAIELYQDGMAVQLSSVDEATSRGQYSQVAPADPNNFKVDWQADDAHILSEQLLAKEPYAVAIRVARLIDFFRANREKFVPVFGINMAAL